MQNQIQSSSSPAGGRTMSMRWEGGCLLLPGGDRMKSTTG
jgi:hypothetical protein